ncbi:MAG TPA: DNA repair protein RadA, partial [Phycisphaerales bacterium]|nr:DNA repair protein RadA [Phycisphaerales bacterium]
MPRAPPVIKATLSFKRILNLRITPRIFNPNPRRLALQDGCRPCLSIPFLVAWQTMAKVKTVYVCQECGAQSPRWSGKCNDCGGWNTFQEESILPKANQTGMTLNQGVGELIALDKVESNTEDRVSSQISELDRVLGGGLVSGVLILLGGAPGIGKSTLLLQLASRLATSLGPVLYVSG